MIVIISPFTNHVTAGVIIEFQAEITVYCDTCTRETINPENIRFLHFTNGGHTRKSIMAAPMFLRIKRSRTVDYRISVSLFHIFLIFNFCFF